MSSYKPNKILCPNCRTEHFWRGAPPTECDKCGEPLDDHVTAGAGFTVSRKPGETFYVESVDQDGNLVRVACEVRSTSRNLVRIAVIAPPEVVIRRAEIPFKGQCEWCGEVLRPGSDEYEPFCSHDCWRASENRGAV